MAWLKDSAADFFVADFFAPAAALVLAAGLAGDFDFVFVPDFGGSSGPQIFDAYLNYRYRPELQLRLGKFKTPGLRNIAITAPYMHNGMFKTLKEVIDFYDNPARKVPRAINRDTILAKPLGLTRREKEDLEAFLLSLTDKQFIK